MPLTAAERKRIERQRKRDAGFVSREIWIHPDNSEALKTVEQALRSKTAIVSSEAGRKGLSIWNY